MSFLGNIAAGAISSMMTNKQIKKAVKALEAENEKNRQILSMGHVPIEDLFDPTDKAGNIIISGGTEYNRARAVIAVAINAYNQNRPVIIIHESNDLLADLVYSVFQKTGSMITVNKENPIFDPFYGLDDMDICELIVESASEKYPISHAGKYYISGMLEYLRAKGFDPLCDYLIACPHHQLFDKVDENVADGTFSLDVGNSIKAKLVRGQAEVVLVEAYFNALKNEVADTLSSGDDYDNLTNVIAAGSPGGILLFDLISNHNNLTLNLLINQIRTLTSHGDKPLIILDSLSSVKAEQLSEFLKIKSVNVNYIISTEDIYTMVGAQDVEFDTIIGNSSMLLVMSHSCGQASNKLAEAIGRYEKKVISYGLGGGGYPASTTSVILGGGSANINISTQSDFRVKPEVIDAMRDDEVYLYNNVKKKLFYATIA